MNELEITPEPIHEYCKAHSSAPSEVLQVLIQATRSESQQYRMQVGPIEGKFLGIIASLMNAKHILEFGTFTGYSALSFAEVLPENGKVTTLDRDPTATAIAKKHWALSPHGKKIELVLGDAHQTILNLENEIKSGIRSKFDLAFIDADKAGYKIYWEACFKLVRPGGAILVDNVLWSGRILNPEDKSDHEINDFNLLAAKDVRVQKVMLPIRDGILLSQIL